MINQAIMKVVQLNNLCKRKHKSLSELIKKEMNCEKVIVSELGGVWVENSESGRILSKDELAELAEKIEASL